MEITIDQALQQSDVAHREGKIEEAERIYQSILYTQPTHPDANHNLGALYVSLDKSEIALPLFRMSLKVNPNIEQFWISYITTLIKLRQFANARQALNNAKKNGVTKKKLNILKQDLVLQVNGSAPSNSDINTLIQYYQDDKYDDTQKLAKSIIEQYPDHKFSWEIFAASLLKSGRTSDALVANQNLVRIDPQDAVAFCNLGLTLQKQGRLSQAEVNYKKAIALKIDYAKAYNNLGNVLKEQDKYEEAEASFRKSIDLKPDFFEAHNNLGNFLEEQDRHEEAEASFRKVIDLKPDFAEFHNNLGITLQKLIKLEEAEGSYRKAIELNPYFAEAHNNLGILLQKIDMFEEAEVILRRAIELNSDFGEAHYNLGNTLQQLGLLEEAEVSYKHAIALKIDIAEVYYNFGNALKELNKFEDAEVNFRKAIILKYDYPKAHNNLGNVLKELSRFKEAEASFRKAITLNSHYAEAYYNLSLTLEQSSQFEDAEKYYNKAIALKPDNSDFYNNKNLCLNYGSFWSPLFVYEEHLKFEKQFGGLDVRTVLNASVPKHSGDTLRVGYVSGDLAEHSVSYFFEPLLEHHNAKAVETFCYYNNTVIDATTKRLMSASDHWRSILGVSDSDVVSQIKNDKIDILVDLSGHTAGNRLLVFAQKPAPIQVSWLGYPTTTGLSAIDYRLTDCVADPVGEADNLHSETLMRLPNGFQCYKGNEDVVVDRNLPQKSRGYITFGSFNNLSKMTPQVIKVWSNILHNVPSSKLLLKSSKLNEDVSNYLKLFEQEGIAADRIEYYQRLPNKNDHLELYNSIDIGLDPFPFNGATTTCEALWMGVPVITLSGDRHVGRVGSSLLTNVGLTDFIAEDNDSYVEIASNMASNTDYLQDIRQGLRARLEGSPLCDGQSFAEDIEMAYKEMWNKYLKDDDL